MPVTSQHVTGFVVGLGVAAAGFYFYKMNQKTVDAWLESQGIHVPGASTNDYSSMTLEETRPPEGALGRPHRRARIRSRAETCSQEAASCQEAASARSAGRHEDPPARGS